MQLPRMISGDTTNIRSDWISGYSSPAVTRRVRLIARDRGFANRFAELGCDEHDVGDWAITVTHRQYRHRDRYFGAVAANLQRRKPRHDLAGERPLMHPPDFVAASDRQQNIVG